MLSPARLPAFAALVAGGGVTWHDLHLSADELLALCDTEDVSALVHHRVMESHSIEKWPVALVEVLSARARASAGEEMLRASETRAVVAALVAAGVHPLLIKGTHLAYSLYPIPAARTRDDTDLLIAGADVETARGVMSSLGYTATVYCSEIFSQFEVQKRDSLGVRHAYDVHWKISTQPVFAGVLNYDEMIARADPIPALGAGAMAPALSDALLLACIHPAMHHRNVERMLWTYDTHLLASRMTPEQFLEFVRVAREKRVAAVCAHELRRAQARFATVVPGDVLRELSQARDEPSAEYLASHRRWHDELASSVRALPAFGDRMKLLRDVLLPRPGYMLASYGLRGKPLASLLLPALYLHRNARGAWKILTRKK